MATASVPRLMTAEQFMAADLGEGAFELVRGEVVEMPPSMPGHGAVCGNTSGLLWDYGRRSGYGYVVANDAAIVTERGPDTVRGADVAFYSHARWPRSQVGNTFPPVPPDLAVEVYSPSNRPGAMSQKVAEYLSAGALMVWVIYPESRTVVIHRPPDQPPVVLRDGDVIENLPELPRFRCDVADLFA